MEPTVPPEWLSVLESEKLLSSVEISKLVGAVNVISASRLLPETVVDCDVDGPEPET